MSRRLGIIIGIVLVAVGLVSLGYVGYILFGGPTGDAKETASDFYLKQSEDVDTSVETGLGPHSVVVTGILHPIRGAVTDWACSKQVWDWGDGELTRNDTCTPLYNDQILEFPSGHVYKAAGTYLVRLYVQDEKNVTFQSDELEVTAP